MNADRTKQWVYVLIFGVVALPFGWVPSVLASSTPWSYGGLINGWLTMVGAFLAIGFGFCLPWYFTTSRIAYVVTADSVEVHRGAKTVRSYDRQRVVDFTMDGLFNVRRCFTVSAPPPNWPNGWLTVIEQDGQLKEVRLPAIMLWGKESVVQTESVIRRALELR